MTKKQKFTLATVATHLLVPNPRNPRVHPEEQIVRLAASIKKFGQAKPVLARAENKMMVAGHGVLEAIKRAGQPETQVLLWDVDQKTADAYMLADNRFSDLSSHDEDRVAELLREIENGDLEAVGFNAEEAAAMLSDLAHDELVVEEIDTGLVADKFWLSVRGPLHLQSKALQRLKEVMKEWPEIDVELGTTAEV